MRVLTAEELDLISGGANQDSPIVVTARGAAADDGFWCGYFGASGFGPIGGGCVGSDDFALSGGVGFGIVQLQHSDERDIPIISIAPEHIVFNLKSSDWQDTYNRGRDAANEMSRRLWDELTRGRLNDYER